MRYMCAAAALLAVAASALRAQDDFEAFRKKEAAQQRAFLSKEDAAFASFLKQTWVDYDMVRARKPLTRPKPREAPAATPATAAPASPPGGTTSPLPTSPPVPPPSVAPPPIAVAAPPASLSARAPSSAPAIKGLATQFFGNNVVVPSVQGTLTPPPTVLTREALSSFWEEASSAKYADVIPALREQANQLGLGDWGYVQLVFRVSMLLARGDTSLARLLSWHLLVKSGYAVRVGFSASNAYTLVKVQQTLFGVSFFTIGSDRFYIIDISGRQPDPSSVQTYEREYPGATKAAALTVRSMPQFGADPMRRSLPFSYKDQSYTLTLDVSRNLMRYLDTYPQMDLDVYLDAESTATGTTSLLAQLRPIIAGLSNTEATELLLHFVQTAFSYKTDGDQFNREKWMLPEETLFYPYSDCEDRAILFAFLVRKLVDADVVGLVYTDHVSTALHLPAQPSGDALMFNGMRFVVADPTYINATIGMAMEQYRGVTPRVVPARRFDRKAQ